ncbi:lipoprotein [Helicobacter pylori]|nr:lipoprotein [Helicobacter pylori]
MKSKITHFIAISFVLSLFSACKDDPKKSSQSHQNNHQTTKKTQNNQNNQANNDVEKIEHEEDDDEKTTKEVNDLIDEENKVDEFNKENADPSQKRTNNVLQRATNHQDNLSSPLNRNY